MKTLIFTVLLGISLNANAAMWTLIHQDYVQGIWMCTYKMDNYERTIQSRSYCQAYIFN